MKTKLAAFAALTGLLFVTTGCTPAQETQVLNDIDAVVNLAGTVLSVAQSFGALDTPQAQSDLAIGEAYAQKLSQAASASITEWNSADPMATKVSAITQDFTAIAPIGELKTAQINASVKLLTAAVQLLIAQLQSVAPAAGANVSVHPRHAGHAIAALVPGTFSHRLNSVKKKADANLALAAKLLAVRR